MVYRNTNFDPWTAAGTATVTTGTPDALVLNRAGYTGFGQFTVAGTSSNPLPVTLSKLTATVKTADVLVSWTTVSESNNSGFDVERSLDGRTFVKVGFVKGAGNSVTTLNYGFTDAKAFATANSAVLYYRLKQVDFNGKFTYSSMVKVTKETQNANAVSIHPNPFEKSYNVSFNATVDGNAVVKMIDMQGRVVIEQTVKTIKGFNQVLVENAADLRSGVYFVNITVDGETQVLKLVKN